MENYIQGLDHVGIGEQFPYPIKCESDGNHIYLTPLWLPKITFKSNTSNIYLPNLQGDGLALVLEVSCQQEYRAGSNQRRHTKGGNFRIPGSMRSQNIILNPVLNQRYEFPIREWRDSFLRGKHYRTPEDGHGNYLNPYYYVRGAYRFNSDSSELRWINRIPNCPCSNKVKINPN